jgi:hypothetical protein
VVGQEPRHGTIHDLADALGVCAAFSGAGLDRQQMMVTDRQCVDESEQVLRDERAAPALSGSGHFSLGVSDFVAGDAEP